MVLGVVTWHNISSSYPINLHVDSFKRKLQLAGFSLHIGLADDIKTRNAMSDLVRGFLSGFSISVGMIHFVQ